jgi:hypothetical protein
VSHDPYKEVEQVGPMSTEAMIDDACRMTGELVSNRAVRVGSRLVALDQIASTYGLGFSRLQSFFHPSRRPKTCDGGWYAKLRGAYLAEVRRVVLNAKHTLEIAEHKGQADAVTAGLLAEAKDLLAKVQEKEKAR